jgi:hypothetical protein
MKLLITVVGIFMTVIFNVSPSFAQFPDLGKFGTNKASAGTGSSASVQDLINTKNKTLGTYVNSIQSMALNLGKTAEAFGVKNQITDNLAIINSLQTGNISDASLSKSRLASDAILGIIKEKMNTTAGLNTGSQRLFYARHHWPG